MGSPVVSSPARGRLLGRQVYTGSGWFSYLTVLATYPGAKRILVKAIGAGGGGGGCINSYVCAGGGGGAGAYVERELVLGSQVGGDEFVTVGGPGAAGANHASTPTRGSTGGVTSFGGWLTATGGVGGSYGSVGNGGQGGVPSSGDLQISGGAGGACSIYSNWGIGGQGGAGFFGGGAFGAGANPSTNAGVVRARGSGGGGGAFSNSAAYTASDGGPGLCIVEIYS